MAKENLPDTVDAAGGLAPVGEIAPIDELSFYAHELLSGSIETTCYYRGHDGGVSRSVTEYIRLEDGDIYPATITEKGPKPPGAGPYFKEISLSVRTPDDDPAKLANDTIVGWSLDGDPSKQWSRIGFNDSSARFGAAADKADWIRKVMDLMWDKQGAEDEEWDL